jgi:hypothetical protein
MARSRPPRDAAPPTPSAPPSERPPSAAPALRRSPATPASVAVGSPERETIFAVLGNTTRAGPWQPAERLLVISALGSVILDFRRADLPPGVTEIEVWSLLGSVEIHVSADLEAELDGFALLGSVEQRAAKGGRVRTRVKRLLGLDDPLAEVDDEIHPDDEPFLEIRANAILGSVLLKVDPE